MSKIISSHKKILMLSQTVFPPDIRLEKEITSLYQNKYEITVICNQYEKNKNPSFPLCEIVRIKALFTKKEFNKILNYPFFLNPRFLFVVIKNVLRIHPDFLHIHDLPMAPIGILLKYIFRVPLILDFHENYPEALRYFDKKGFINFLFKNPKLALILERFCVKFADKVIVVVEENKENLIKNGVPAENIVVVSNTVDLSTFAVEKTDEKIIDKYKDSFVILYTGNVSPERGLDTAVKAVKSIRTVVKNLKMVIVGDGPSVEPLKNIAETLGVSDSIEFVKWPGHNNLVSYLKCAKICMIPQPSNSFIDTTIPHKLFETMSQAIPVITSDAKPFKRILNETKAGIVFRSNDPGDFSEKIIEFSKSDEPYGLNGRKAVIEKYNWNRDADQLLDIYNKLSNLKKL